MIGVLWAALGVLGGLSMTVIGDMVSEEIRDRLDRMPHVILRLAARWLDSEQRATVYEDEWMPELSYILRGDETRPVTRLYHGTRYAVGILMVSGRLARQLRRAQASPDRVELTGLQAILALTILTRSRVLRKLPRWVLAAAFVVSIAGGVVFGWLVTTYIAQRLVYIVGAAAFCVDAPVAFLAFRHRALIRALVRAKPGSRSI